MRRVGWFVIFLAVPLFIQAQHFFEAGVKAGMAAWNAQTYYVSPQPNLHAGME